MKVHTRSARRGQVLILVAMMATLLFGLAAIALDLSMAMSDRRVLQANVDAAALAGAVEYPTGTNAAHWVALQYLQKPLGYALPIGSCTSKAACPAGTYSTGAYTITIGDPGARLMDLSIQHTEPGLFANIIGATVKTGNSVRTTAPGPTIIGSNYGIVATTGAVDITGGGATNRVVGTNVWVATDFGDNNGGIHTTVMTYVTDFAGVTCPGNIPLHVDHGAATNGLAFTWNPAPGTELFNVNPAPTPYDNYSPTVPAGAPTFGAAGFPLNAQDGSGNWKPGIYDGVYPSAPGKLNPGVYKLINNASPMNFGALTQVIYTAAGTEDAAGAIVIVLDSSDTAAMDISAVKLNGIDDLHPQSYVGPRDPQGTHNFVFFGGNGATAYTGSQNFGPATNVDISGIFYIPKYTATGTGNPVELLTGQITVAAWTIAGGGGSNQVLRWVCGLGMVLGNTATQGGINR